MIKDFIDLLKSIPSSIFSTIIFAAVISIINTIKTKKEIKKIIPNYVKTKKHFKELCNNSFIITPACKKNDYIIQANYFGGYNSLLLDLESQRDRLIKLSKYSFVQNKQNDNILNMISIYENIIYRLSIISIQNFDGIKVTFDKDKYQDDVTDCFNKLDRLYKIK